MLPAVFNEFYYNDWRLSTFSAPCRWRRCFLQKFHLYSRNLMKGVIFFFCPAVRSGKIFFRKKRNSEFSFLETAKLLSVYTSHRKLCGFLSKIRRDLLSKGSCVRLVIEKWHGVNVQPWQSVFEDSSFEPRVTSISRVVSKSTGPYNRDIVSNRKSCKEGMILDSPWFLFVTQFKPFYLRE